MKVYKIQISVGIPRSALCPAVASHTVIHCVTKENWIHLVAEQLASYNHTYPISPKAGSSYHT